MPREESLHPPGEERETERKLVSAHPASSADSAREAGQEDFLFHLYRGSELLQDNRVLEAKEELEYALTLQPRDSKGQDLLAAVYFRLGLYPRAISIYENLQKLFPKDSSLRLNLALCYLKTGQPEAARTALGELVKESPNHKRAWGYLGLVHEKLGDFEEAQVAFERGGHAHMAKRMVERKSRVTVPAPSGAPQSASGNELRVVAGLAFDELDAGDITFSLAEPAAATSEGGTWHAIELGAIVPRYGEMRSPFSKTLAPPNLMEMVQRETETALPPPERELNTRPPPPENAADHHTRPPPPELNTKPPPPEVHTAPPPVSHALAAPLTPVISAPPADMGQAAQESLVVFPDREGIGIHPSGVILVQTSSTRPFAVRQESMRAGKGAIGASVLMRKLRDKPGTEILGGVGSPLVEIATKTELVLGPRHGHRLFPLVLHDDRAFVREDLLLGFELGLTYENGRIAVDEAEPIHVVQLRGSGTLVLELYDQFMSLEASSGAAVTVRREFIVGWTGRLVPRPIPPAEAPSGQRGLVSFTGEGSVLVAGR
jgi:uncharacterized protein (AIM24 family)